MFNSDTDLIFPPRVIPALRDLRNGRWADLIDDVAGKEDVSEENLSFVLMMVRLTGCLTCNVDAYRALRGCTECASQAVRRYKGSDTELLEAYNKAQKDIRRKLKK